MTAGSSSTASTGSGSGSASHDDDATEPERRNGKKTGLAGPDEKPEVITEELVRAIGNGKIPVRRFIDPAVGVIEAVETGGVEAVLNDSVQVRVRQLCDTAEARVASYIFEGVSDELDNTPGFLEAEIRCSNRFAAAEDPQFGRQWSDDKTGAVPMKHVSCWGKLGFHLEWVPDAERGFRIAAIVLTETSDSTLWTPLSTRMKQAKRCK